MTKKLSQSHNQPRPCGGGAECKHCVARCGGGSKKDYINPPPARASLLLVLAGPSAGEWLVQLRFKAQIYKNGPNWVRFFVCTDFRGLEHKVKPETAFDFNICRV